jgi:hypothetical protein
MSRVPDEAIAAAGRVLANARARQGALTPREAAEEAYVPGGPPVDELEARIRRRREQATQLASSLAGGAA